MKLNPWVIFAVIVVILLFVIANKKQSTTIVAPSQPTNPLASILNLFGVKTQTTTQTT